MDPYLQIAEAIVQKEITILAEIAIERAKRVHGIDLDPQHHVVKVQDGKRTLEELIEQYQELLGPAGVSFARDAALPIAKQHPELDLPQALR